ncbi:MAG: hypothetical protein AA908_00230 [Chlorobi bacterium NICIL-2]|nr:MAG: hypothetical protein AA908_00230 [Chlorobi bacterium NICIL-2]
MTIFAQCLSSLLLIVLSLLLGGLIGFVLALPPGPVAVTVMASALRGRWRHGLAAAAGASLADGVIALGVLFASSALVELLSQMIANHPALAVVGEIAVVAALVTYAVRLGRSSVLRHSSELRDELGRSVRGTVISAAATAIANIVNPTFLPSLAGAFAAALSFLAHRGAITTAGKFLMALGFVGGTFAWLAVVVGLIVRNHARFSLRHIMLLRRIGAAVVMIFALVLLWHIATS